MWRPGTCLRRSSKACAISCSCTLRYYEILEPHSSPIDIWETKYLQILGGEDAVFRWVSGTGLRPFVDALEGAEREGFVARIQGAAQHGLPMRPSGKTLFPFSRIFAVARK